MLHVGLVLLSAQQNVVCCNSRRHLVFVGYPVGKDHEFVIEVNSLVILLLGLFIISFCQHLQF